MKRREGKGPPSADLLVCFPSRAHLTLMPKALCSPARASESNKRQQNQPHHHHHHHHHHQHPSHHHHRLKKSINGGGSAGQASPSLWAKTKAMSSEISEPTSPKVTCAGQIKVRHKINSCKNWQSVMEEIERLHNRKQKKRHTWSEALGFKKEIMQFLTCLRSMRLDFRCFGSVPTSDIISDDDDVDEDDEDFHEKHLSREASDDSEASRTVFSKWFMVLQENQNKDFFKNQFKDSDASYSIDLIEKAADDAPCAPPPNALLLMRCRSAPAKSWQEEMEQEDDEEENDEEDENEEEEEEKRAQLAMEEEKKKLEESLVAMRYNTDFAMMSIDIAKETWVVGEVKDPLSRSRSWKK